MKVKCIANTGAAYNGYKMPVGYNKEAILPLDIGKEYLVMGMLVGEGVTKYLIDPVSSPGFYALQLFEVSDPKIPANWYFKAFKLTDKHYPYWQAIWGYQELMNNDYLEELMLGEKQDAAITYFKRKMEAEKAKILEQILLDKKNRKVLIEKFQQQIWDDQNANEILSELAYDLDFYEPNEGLRRESESYYGDDKLEELLNSAIQKLKASN